MPCRKTILPKPWKRLDDGSRGKTSARYSHPAGYLIEHCGHPTALWPYALYGPDGAMILAPNGRAWRMLIFAALEVERRLGNIRDVALTADRAVNKRGKR